MTDPLDALDFIASLDFTALRPEVLRLRSIEAWAYAQQPVAVGDRVALGGRWTGVDDPTSGWWHYRECLAPGASVIVQDVHYNHFREPGRWQASVQPEQEWALTDNYGRRYSLYEDGEQRRHTFVFPLDCLRAARVGDGLAMPADAQPWDHRRAR